MRSAQPVPWSIAAALAAAAPSQVPPNAVILNPTLPGLLVVSCAHSGDAVHALGFVPTAVPFTAGAFYAKSSDGGRTWPLREVPIGAGNGGGIAADGSTVVAVLLRNRAAPLEVHSSDGGTTWSAPRALGIWGGFQGTAEIALHVQGTTVNVVWTDFRPGAGWLWLNRSTDGGATWLPTEQRFDNSNPIFGQLDTRPQCFGVGANVHVFWTQNENGTLWTMYQRSTDTGATWLPAPLPLAPSRARGIVATSSVLLVGTQPPQRSIDQGATWNPAPGPNLSFPILGGDAANVLAAVPVVTTLGSLFSLTVLVDKSVDGGLTWSGPVQAFPPLLTQLHPDAEATPFIVGDAWYLQMRGQTLPTVLRLSVDQGTNWRTVANRHETYWPAPARIVATIDGAYAHVLAGHAGVGAGTTGSGGIEPQLHGVGIPGPGLTFALEMTHALGGSIGLLGFGVGAPAPVPFGSGTVFVPLPITSLFVATGGVAGVPGSGGFTWVLPVPNDLVFAGLQLVSQGAVMDAGAADGFCLTAGLESRLH